MGDKAAFFVLIEKIYGSDARAVLETLMKKGKELTEGEIAEHTKLKISSIRRALNTLAESNLVVYRKVQLPDRARPIFYWRANESGIRSIILSRKRATLEKLKTLLDYEMSTYYYICPFDGARYTFEEALEYDFVCPRCGSVLQPDTRREERIRLLREVIERLERELSNEEKV